MKNGRIKQSLAYWCLNATEWQWDIDRICQTACRLGCRSVELVPPELWPTVRKYGLEIAIAMNGMPDPVFTKGLNNPQIPRGDLRAAPRPRSTAARIPACPNVIAFTGYQWRDPFDPASGEIPRDEGAAQYGSRACASWRLCRDARRHRRASSN